MLTMVTVELNYGAGQLIKLGTSFTLLPCLSCNIKYIFTLRHDLNTQLKTGTFPGTAPAGDRPLKTGMSDHST